MRPVRHDDVIDAARALWTRPAAERPALARLLVQQARWADLYRKRIGFGHKSWGDGSLGGAARMRTLPCEPPLRVKDFQHCIWCVLDALLD